MPVKVTSRLIRGQTEFLVVPQFPESLDECLACRYRGQIGKRNLVFGFDPFPYDPAFRVLHPAVRIRNQDAEVVVDLIRTHRMGIGESRFGTVTSRARNQQSDKRCQQYRAERSEISRMHAGLQESDIGRVGLVLRQGDIDGVLGCRAQHFDTAHV